MVAVAPAQPGAVAQHAELAASQGDAQERLPDGPGIDGTALDGRAGIRRLQGNDLDIVGDVQPGLFERFVGEVVGAAAPGQTDLLALEVGHRLDGRVGLDDQGLTGVGGLVFALAHGYEFEVGPARQGEDPRGVPHRAKVHRARVEGL